MSSQTYLMKATDNYEAGDFLLKKGLFGPGVHCFYYFVIQIVYHVLTQCQGENFEGISEERRQNQSGSHVTIRSKIESHLATKYGRTTAHNFRRKFKDLQQKRVIADYHALVMGQEDCYNSKLMAEDLRDFLKDKFDYERC